MKKKQNVLRTLILTSLVLVAVVTAALFGGTSKVGATGDIDITGTVTDSSGSPIEGVSVYATDAGDSDVDYGPVTTDASGYYDLSVLAGYYDFHFDPPSGSSSISYVDSGVTVFGDQTINEQLSPLTYTLSGTLSDQSGNPLPYATVALKDGGSTVGSATTDSDGNYSISVVPGTYALEVSDQNNTVGTNLNQLQFTQVSAGIDLTSGNVTQNLTVDTATIQVTVLDSNGNPVTGTSVIGQDYDYGGTGYLYSGDPGESLSYLYNNTDATTNGSGVVDLTTIVGAEYDSGNDSSGSICATISGGTYCLASPLTITGDTDVTIQQPTTYTLSGTLSDQSGNPLPYATVALKDGGSTVGSATTDSDGNYSISVVPGTYALEVSDQNNTVGTNLNQLQFTQVSAGIDLTSGNVTQNLTVDTATIQVTVLDSNGNPVTGTSVIGQDYDYGGTGYLYSGDPGESLSYLYNNTDATTNGSGVVDLTTIVGAEYDSGNDSSGSICATISGGTYCLASPLTITGDTDVTIQQPTTYTLSGTLSDQSGNPLPYATVALKDGGSTVGSATTDSDGNYSISVVPGTYALEVSDQNNTVGTNLNQLQFTQVSAGIDLTSGNVTQNLTVDTATIQVTVLDSNGNPVTGTSVIGQDYDYGGTGYLYSGDPGESLSYLYNNTDATTNGSGVVDLTTIVGAEYDSGNDSSGSICATISGGTYCLASPLTITGDTDVTIQQP